MSAMNQSPSSNSSPPIHEAQDVSWPTVLWITAISAAVIIALVLCAAAMYASLMSRFGADSTQLPAAKVEQANQLLQLRQQQEEQLSTYDWISRDDRVARIPIDRAIDLIVAERAKP